MDTDTIAELLEQVNAIKKKNYEIVQKNGKNFNVFKILKLNSNEVRTHSAFIAELLNPNGSHGRGNLFIKEFISLLKEKVINSSDQKPRELVFDSENVNDVNVEYWLGPKTKSKGGYIDILLIDNKGQHIIIENKIYAGDQDNQLLRYHNFDSMAPIVYLTLEGKKPSENSTGNNKDLEDELICLSYESDIINWLEKCNGQIKDLPIITETIKQYIYLIKHLTHQTMERDEIDEIVNSLIGNSDQIEALRALSDNKIWDEVRKKIILDLGSEIIGVDGITKELNLIVEFSKDIDFGFKGYEFWLYKKNWKYCIHFYFADNFEDIIYGINIKNSKDKILASELKKFKGVLGESPNNDGWIWSDYFKEYEKTSWFNLIVSGRNLFRDKVKEVMQKAEDLM